MKESEAVDVVDVDVVDAYGYEDDEDDFWLEKQREREIKMQKHAKMLTSLYVVWSLAIVTFSTIIHFKRFEMGYHVHKNTHTHASKMQNVDLC